jgi:hypothetical protein
MAPSASSGTDCAFYFDPHSRRRAMMWIKRDRLSFTMNIAAYGAA